MPIDYKEYHPEWKTAIRPAILERANHKCEQCGVPNRVVIKRLADGFRFITREEADMIKTKIFVAKYQRAKAIKLLGFTEIVLTIAHLDHNKANNDHSNLKALCQKCHLNHDKLLHAANRKKNKENPNQLNLL